jgi:preprotein translocase subunit SecD
MVMKQFLSGFLYYLVCLWCITGCAQIPAKVISENSGSSATSKDFIIKDSSYLPTGWYYVVDSPNGYKKQLDKSAETYYLDPVPVVTSKNILSFEIYETTNQHKKYHVLVMPLDKNGTLAWSSATRKSSMRMGRLAFVVKNSLLYAANVNEQITGGITALNRGVYTRKELEKIQIEIESEK